MRKKSKKSGLFWLQIWLATLSAIIVALFVMISNLDNKELENKIDKIKTEYSDNIKSIRSELENTKNLLNAIVITQTKNDSTFIKKIEKFQQQTNDLETKIESLEKKGNSSVGNTANFNFMLLWILVMVVIAISVSFYTSWVFNWKRNNHDNGDGEKRMPVKGPDDHLKKGDFEEKVKKEKPKEDITESQGKKQIEISVVNDKNNELDTLKQTEYIEKFYRMPENNIFIEEVTNQTDAYFKVFEIKSDNAKYEYCGSAVNSDLLRGICKFNNSPYTGDKIDTVKPGVVKKENDKWSIDSDNLAEIEFKP